MPAGPALVVGLGNPGPSYADTRHNVGFGVVELLAARAGGGRFSRHRSNADVLEGRLAGRRVVLAKPRTYMNVSGGPVAGLVRYFSVPVGRPGRRARRPRPGFGVVRLKRGGGEGGHNGLRSISTSLGTRDYLRVRFGIGRPPGRQDPADFVLKRFSATERKELDLAVDLAADAAEALLADGPGDRRRTGSTRCPADAGSAGAGAQQARAVAARRSLPDGVLGRVLGASTTTSAGRTPTADTTRAMTSLRISCSASASPALRDSTATANDSRCRPPSPRPAAGRPPRCPPARARPPPPPARCRSGRCCGRP